MPCADRGFTLFSPPGRIDSSGRVTLIFLIPPMKNISLKIDFDPFRLLLSSGWQHTLEIGEQSRFIY
jgi:hypothetical protein